MIKYLLDTNVISEAIKTVPNKNVMRKLEKHQAEMATASLVWHELQYGCRPFAQESKTVDDRIISCRGRVAQYRDTSLR